MFDVEQAFVKSYFIWEADIIFNLFFMKRDASKILLRVLLF